MTGISKSHLRKFLKIAGKELEGKWVIIGGSVLPLIEINDRVTMDIDIAPVFEANQTHTLTLMEIAESVGLPVEAINQAGAYFLRKIPDWQQSLIEIHKGQNSVFYRPDVNLFIKLKCARLTETDLSDCKSILKFATKNNEAIDKKALLKCIALHRKSAIKDNNAEKVRRLENISELIDET